MTTHTPVHVRDVAESLARIADDDDGFNPDTADTIEADLRALAEKVGYPTDVEAMHPGDARHLQDVWLTRLKDAVS